MEFIDSKTLIKKFYKFFEEFKKKEVKKAINEGHEALYVSFTEISEYDFELGEQILGSPIELLSIMEETLKQFFENSIDSKRKIKIRLSSLPVTEKLMIRDIRSEHIGKLILLEGLVRRKTDVRPRLQYLEYLCTNPSCTYSEQKLKIPQLEDKARTIKTCPKCKSGVEMINKLLLDSQNLILEEIPEQLENSGDQPKRIGVLLQEDLVSPFKDSKTNPGSRVYVIGIVKEIPIPTKTGAESIKYDLIVEGNYIDMTEEDYSDIVISKEEIEQIKELSKEEEIMKILVKNTAPSIYGYNKIKEAMLLQLFGGAGNVKGDGIKTRATIHMLLLGDPGAAKSQLLKSITSIAPKSMFVSGKSATGAGLCVAPKSRILTNPGGIITIENLVENNLTNPHEYKPGILKQDNIKNIKIQSLSNEFKIHSQIPKSIWKLESPKKVFEIILSSGKKIELTGNTALFKIENGKTKWEKSMNLKLGEYIATPRTLIQGKKEIFLIDLIKSYPHLHEIEDYVKNLINKIKKEKKLTTRQIANEIKVNENNLYHNWVTETSKGKIKLDILKKLIKLLNDTQENENYKKNIKKVSLYNGKTHKLPIRMNKKVAYLAGLIAGDGDLRYIKDTKTYQIRLSNSDEKLHKIFQNILSSEFALNFDVQNGNTNRPKTTRTHSKLLGEILINLGVHPSPKSNKIHFSEHLLHLSNEILSEYIAGLYDSDGSVCIRNSGSNVIELSSCSENLIRELQLVFLRFNIHTKIRFKKPTIGKINGNYTRWVLEIRGQDQFKNFFESIPLKHEKKSSKLKLQINKNIVSNTNVDIIPQISTRIASILKSHNLSLKEFDCRKNLSRQGCKKLLDKLDKKLEKEPEFEDIKKIVNSDIFWEKIIEINIKDATYDYVYDLTVENSHNFVVDGVLVHNTATVVKDENTGGWALEAGAMVLANGGICAIDELDKMSEDDTSTMHEALEQQCYHNDFELQFANGETQKIGEFVEKYFQEYKKDIIQGIDCEILNIKTKELLTTDFNKIQTTMPQRISRHKPFKNYYKITYSNGREIVVTPQHPVFVFKNNQIEEISAALVEKGMLVPAPCKLPIKGEKQELESVKLTHHNNKKIQFPKKLSKDLALLLGLHASEGHSHYNIENRYAEIGISNTDETFKNKTYDLFEKIFNTHININISKKENRLKATKDLYTIRCSSIPLYKFFELNFPELLNKAPEKRIPNMIKKSTNSEITSFLEGYYSGDGFIDNYRCGFSTSSFLMAQDLQDLLLRLEIISYISTEKRKLKKYYKVVISGKTSIEKFLKKIVKDDFRNEKIENLLKTSQNKNNSRDLAVPYEFLIPFNSFLKKIHVSDGYFTNLINRKQNSNKETVLKYLEKSKIKINKIKVQDKFKYEHLKTEFENFVKFVKSDIRFLKITNVEKITDKKYDWVYDVTVLPNKTFLSQGLVLHNTISIAKANIRATLKCETTVLAAANPKYGRFDPYGDIMKQIVFPPALVSRFDLIFIIRDIPDKKKDALIAGHILEAHKDKAKTISEIQPDFLKKYIAYAKKIKPILTNEAIDKIRDFYVSVRNASGGEEGEGNLKSVPITARQLEAIVRLAEAYAKIKLDKKVTLEYADKAIDMLMYCLEKIGIDPRTGQLDIDKITTGITTSTRNQYKIVQQIIDKLEMEKPEISSDDIITEGKKQNLNPKEVETILGKLKTEGVIFEPRKNIYKKLP